MRIQKAAILTFAAIVCVIFILCFPVSKTYSISGNGTVQSSEHKRLSNCDIAIKVTELKSILRYKRNFSFALDGKQCYAPKEVRFPASFSVTDVGDCWISQFNYQAETNTMEVCSLFYPGDRSFAKVLWHGNAYCLGTE